MRAIGQSENRFPLILFIVLSLNLFAATAILAMLIALGYIFLHNKYFSKVKKSEFVVLRNVSWPIFVMMCIGFLVGIYGNNETYDILKDLYFFLKALIFFLFGYVCYKKFAINRIIATFVWVGILVSVSYLVLLFGYSVTGLIDLSSIYLYRKSIPELPYDPLISIMLLLFFPKSSNSYSLSASMLVIVQTIAVASSLSRLSLLVLIVVFIMRLSFKLNISKGVFLLGSMVITLTLAIGSMYAFKGYDNGNSDSVNSQFMGKVTNSFQEIGSSDFSDDSLIRTNWRAYETLQGVIKFFSGSNGQKIFGHGFGELTSVGIDIKLGGTIRNEIPIFHNGYIYILVKLGLVGMFLYIVFLYSIIKITLSSRIKSRFLDIAMQKRGEKYSLGALIFFLIFITLVFFGIFNNAIFNNILVILIVLLLELRSIKAGPSLTPSGVGVGLKHRLEHE